MSQPNPVNILSDDDDDVVGKPYNTKDSTPPIAKSDAVCIDLSTPSPNFPKQKKQRLSDPANLNPSSSKSSAPVFIIDDDITLRKHSLGPTAALSIVTETPPISSHFSSKLEEASIVKCSYASFGLNSTPSIVDETPISELLSKSEVAIVKFNRGDSNSQPSAAATLLSGRPSPESRLLCLQSDNESERGLEGQEPDEATGFIVDVAEEFEFSSRFVESTFSYGEANEMHMSGNSSARPNSLEDDLSQARGTFGDESDIMELMDEVFEPKGKNKSKAISGKDSDNSIGKGRMSKEERLRLKEERKQQKEQEKLEIAAQKAEVAELKKLQKEKQKINLQQEKLERAAQKAEAAELKKLQKEKQKWETGKFAQKTIVAQIDSKIVEMGSIGV